MKKQRSSGRRSRRNFLRAVGTVGLAGVAGCLKGNSRGSVGSGGSGSTEGGSPITILGAGSLNNALLNGLEPAVETPVQIETHGSARVARMIDEGLRDPAIVAVADTALFDQPLTPPWHSVFTSNAIVIAYNSETEGGQRLVDAGADAWYTVLAGDDIDLGRTDPDQDPLGYRTLFMLELASQYYNIDDLKSKILQQNQIYPESSLISRFETGSVDAVIAYRNMAVERGYEFISLPDQIDLSNPNHIDEYSMVSYSLPNGTAQGGCISYGATLRTMSDAALGVFDALTTGAYLERHGFILRESFPTYEGDVPQQIERKQKQNRKQNRTSSRADSNRSTARAMVSPFNPEI